MVDLHSQLKACALSPLKKNENGRKTSTHIKTPLRENRKKNEELDTEIDSKIRKYQDIIKKEFIYFKRDYTVLANAR